MANEFSQFTQQQENPFAQIDQAQASNQPTVQPTGTDIHSRIKAKVEQKAPGMWDQIKHQLGLTARYLIEGPAQTAGVFTEPVRQVQNIITGAKPGEPGYAEPLGQMASQYATELGLPQPQTPQERIVGTASRVAAGGGGMAGAAAKAAPLAEGVTGQVLGALSRSPAQQIAGGAAGGAAGQTVKEAGGGPVAQFGAAVAGGFGGAGGAALIGRLGGAINGIARNVYSNMAGQKVTYDDAMHQMERIIQTGGIELGQIPFSVRNQMAKEMQKAMNTGKPIREDVVKRLADYMTVGATPTRGTVTLEPGAITREKNLAKLGIQSTDPNLQGLANIQNENVKAMISKVNEMGGATQQAPAVAGEHILNALRKIDQPIKAAVSQKYKDVRGATGRYAEMDVPSFSKMANDALDQQQLGPLLPSTARGYLNDISSGKIPLNVNTAEQIDSRLSGLINDAERSGNSQQALAVRVVRDALNNTPIASTEGENAYQAYTVAREAAKQRFAGIKATPAMKAALDYEQPDKFISNYITGAGKKSSISAVRNLANTLKKGNRQAYQAAREQIMLYLKRGAVGNAADETANFSAAGYNRALTNLGDEKLKAFFTPREINDIKAVGRVASYETYQPRGSAVNNSNTASAFASVLERIALSPLLKKIPFGQQMIAEPAQYMSSTKEIQKSLSPMGAMFLELQKQAPEKMSPGALLIPMAGQAESR